MNPAKTTWFYGEERLAKIASFEVIAGAVGTGLMSFIRNIVGTLLAQHAHPPPQSVHPIEYLRAPGCTKFSGCDEELRALVTCIYTAMRVCAHDVSAQVERQYREGWYFHPPSPSLA